jgi:hypothetical protein
MSAAVKPGPGGPAHEMGVGEVDDLLVEFARALRVQIAKFGHDDRVGLVSQFACGRSGALGAPCLDRAGDDILGLSSHEGYRLDRKAAARGLILAFAGAVWAGCSGDVAGGGSASSGGGGTVPGSGGSSNTSYDQACTRLVAASYQIFNTCSRSWRRRPTAMLRPPSNAWAPRACRPSLCPAMHSGLPTWRPAHKPTRP